MVETASLGNNSTGGGGGGIGDVAGADAGGGGGGIPSGLPFQVGYREAGQEYTLYLLAAREQDRAEWIRAIRAGKSPVLAPPSRLFLASWTFPSNVPSCYSNAPWFALPGKRRDARRRFLLRCAPNRTPISTYSSPRLRYLL